MIRTIQSLPPIWAALGYTLLALGLIFVVGFLVRYVTHFHDRTEEGKHLIAMSANIGAFFVVYLVQLIWPTIPGRGFIMLGLLLFLVVNCGRRWWLLEKHLREKRRSAE